MRPMSFYAKPGKKRAPINLAPPPPPARPVVPEPAAPSTSRGRGPGGNNLDVDATIARILQYEDDESSHVDDGERDFEASTVISSDESDDDNSATIPVVMEIDDNTNDPNYIGPNIKEVVAGHLKKFEEFNAMKKTTNRKPRAKKPLDQNCIVSPETIEVLQQKADEKKAKEERQAANKAKKKASEGTKKEGTKKPRQTRKLHPIDVDEEETSPSGVGGNPEKCGECEVRFTPRDRMIYGCKSCPRRYHWLCLEDDVRQMIENVRGEQAKLDFPWDCSYCPGKKW